MLVSLWPTSGELGLTARPSIPRRPSSSATPSLAAFDLATISAVISAHAGSGDCRELVRVGERTRSRNTHGEQVLAQIAPDVRDDEIRVVFAIEPQEPGDLVGLGEVGQGPSKGEAASGSDEHGAKRTTSAQSVDAEVLDVLALGDDVQEVAGIPPARGDQRSQEWNDLART